MLNSTKKYFDQVIRGKKTGSLITVLKGLLWLLSIPYRFAIFCRNWAYDYEWLRPYQPPIPVVISIGNIVVGGSGKTPITLWLAGAFCEEARIGILSRGYNSPRRKITGAGDALRREGPYSFGGLRRRRTFYARLEPPGRLCFRGKRPLSVCQHGS